MTPDAKDEVVRILRLLVDADYASIDRLTGGRKLDAHEIRRAIAEYGRTLCGPPDGAWQIDELAIRDSSRWSVVCPLWSIEEGRSDLSLELTVDDHAGGPRVEIDGLHVL